MTRPLPTVTGAQARVLGDIWNKTMEPDEFAVTKPSATLADWIREVPALHALGFISKGVNGRDRVRITQRGRIALAWFDEQARRPMREVRS